MWKAKLRLDFSPVVLAVLLLLAGCSVGGDSHTAAVDRAGPTLQQSLDLIALLLNDESDAITYQTERTASVYGDLALSQLR